MIPCKRWVDVPIFRYGIVVRIAGTEISATPRVKKSNCINKKTKMIPRIKLLKPMLSSSLLILQTFSFASSTFPVTKKSLIVEDMTIP